MSYEYVHYAKQTTTTTTGEITKIPKYFDSTHTVTGRGNGFDSVIELCTFNRSVYIVSTTHNSPANDPYTMYSTHESMLEITFIHFLPWQSIHSQGSSNPT